MGTGKDLRQGQQVDYLMRRKVMSLSPNDGGDDSKEEWVGCRFWGRISRSQGGRERVLWLLRFRTPQKYYSNPDRHNPSEAEGVAAGGKGRYSCALHLLVCKHSAWQTLSVPERAGQLCPVFGFQGSYWKSVCKLPRKAPGQNRSWKISK